MNKYIENLNKRVRALVYPEYFKNNSEKYHTHKHSTLAQPIIPNMYNFEKDDTIIISNYKVTHLKNILDSYELSKTGSKIVLWNRLIMYLKLSTYALKIQTLYRKWKVHRIFNLFNKYEITKPICINDTDFYNLDSILDIPKYQFISFQDIDNKHYGFNISSLFTLLSSKLLNPYNRNTIPVKVINELHNIEYYKDILCLPTIFKLTMDLPPPINMTQVVELRALRFFQYINELGNYSDPIWYMSLTTNKLLRMVHKLKDIWAYRAELTSGQKYNICPRGDPFNTFRLEYNPYTMVYKNNILDLLEQFVYYGVNNESKTLGAYYVLGSLTLVSREAAECMPWLYESLRDDL